MAHVPKQGGGRRCLVTRSGRHNSDPLRAVRLPHAGAGQVTETMLAATRILRKGNLSAMQAEPQHGGSARAP